MIDYPNLVPECNVDTVFVEMLGYKNPNHASSIGQVASIFLSKKIKGKIIGFIDDDKKVPPYFQKFEPLDKIGSISLLKYSKADHYLVVVKPAMDKFLFDLGNTLDIPKKSLPNDFKAFKALTKQATIQKNSQFRNYVNAIVQKKPEEIKRVKSWIEKYS